MWKVFLIGTILICTLNAMASEYCFDRGLMATYRAKEGLLNCDSSIDTHKFDVLAKKLHSLNIISYTTGAYQKKALKALGDLYELYYSKLPYSDKTEHNPCVQQELKKFPDLKEKVLDAIILCSSN